MKEEKVKEILKGYIMATYQRVDKMALSLPLSLSLCELFNNIRKVDNLPRAGVAI